MKGKHEIWCQLHLSRESTYRISKFLQLEYGVIPKDIISNMHLTVYHSTKEMNNVFELAEECNHVFDTQYTRFMVLAPGGENPKPRIKPKNHKIGIRIQKQSDIYHTIISYRNRLIQNETVDMIGNRMPSTRTKSAFGLRNFQPHISFLKTGSRINPNLFEVGNDFRFHVQELRFDRFSIKKFSNY